MCLYLILKVQVVLLGRKYPTSAMLMGRSLEQNENGLHTNKKEERCYEMMKYIWQLPS